MTILEAIHRVDVLKPNAYTQHDKVVWLAALDGRVQIEVYDTHYDSPKKYWPYTDDTRLDEELLVPFPYDDLYVPWLAMQIDEQNREIASYNNNAAAFNAKYADFKAYWNRTHRPKSEHLRFFGRKYNGGNCGALVGRAGEEIANPLSD